MPLALIALAVGGLGIGLCEFVVLGLLPEIAGNFSVSESTAGWLVSGYALSVAVGALAITATVGGRNRKHMLIALMLVFIFGNVLSALAPSYGVLLAGRIFSAMCHGAFFGIGAVVAGNLVPADRKAQAIAVMFGGLTLANVLGVPFGTLVGQQLGWRASFWAITAIGVVGVVLIAALIPESAARAEAGSTRLRDEFQVLRRRQVLLSLLVTMLGFGGMFGAFTYIAYTLTRVTGFGEGAIPALLVVFGVGLFVGNVAGGKLADRNLGRTLIGVLSALVVVMVAFALVAGSKPLTVLALLLLGATGFAAAPGYQMRVLRYAGGASTLASAANIGAFNLGNAAGAWLGGLVIAAGLGYTSPIWAGAAVTAAGLLVLVLAERAVPAAVEPPENARLAGSPAG